MSIYLTQRTCLRLVTAVLALACSAPLLAQEASPGSNVDQSKPAAVAKVRAVQLKDSRLAFNIKAAAWDQWVVGEHYLIVDGAHTEVVGVVQLRRKVRAKRIGIGRFQLLSSSANGESLAKSLVTQRTLPLSEPAAIVDTTNEETSRKVEPSPDPALQQISSAETPRRLPWLAFDVGRGETEFRLISLISGFDAASPGQVSTLGTQIGFGFDGLLAKIFIGADWMQSDTSSVNTTRIGESSIDRVELNRKAWRVQLGWRDLLKLGKLHFGYSVSVSPLQHDEETWSGESSGIFANEKYELSISGQAFNFGLYWLGPAPAVRIGVETEIGLGQELTLASSNLDEQAGSAETYRLHSIAQIDLLNTGRASFGVRLQSTRYWDSYQTEGSNSIEQEFVGWHNQLALRASLNL